MDLYLDCVGFFFSTHVGGYARVEGAVPSDGYELDLGVCIA